MCNISQDRVRITKILVHTIGLRLDTKPASLQELTKLCVASLRIYYDGACPEECLEARARDFAAWHLARLGYDDNPAGGNHAPVLGRASPDRG